MTITDRLLAALPGDATVQEIRIGAFWTAVVVKRDGKLRCGLAAALRGGDHHQSGHFPVREAGHLLERSALELAGLLRSDSLLEASIGMATTNALLEADETAMVELNAEDVIREKGSESRVAIVGHFPFIERLRAEVGQMWVLEMRLGPGDLPAEAAAEVIPQADVVAITSTTLINGTCEDLLALCRPEATVLLLGPSTPLSPLLFEHVDVLSGSLVDDVDTVLRLVGQGATFRQIHRGGVRLVTMARQVSGSGDE
ncbi:MAG TPA: DUF364 domain-containing protein [Anaerolineae bacterium]|nr:DUF364 domain-containing protein [Anaerolineae bacterium]